MLNNIVDNIDYNVGSKTLFNAVFNNPKQVVRFLLCTVKNDFFNLAILLLNIYLKLWNLHVLSLSATGHQL